MAALDEARSKTPKTTLVVYYTGHGAVGVKDVPEAQPQVRSISPSVDPRAEVAAALYAG